MPQKLFLPFLGLALILLTVLLLWQTKNSNALKNPIVINNIEAPPLLALDAEKIAQGEILYQQYCAACHGVNLEGASDWKKTLPDGSLPPPPHDDSGHTWHHPDFLLLQIMAEGGKPIYDGVMPGFATQLTIQDMRAILEYIKSHWSRESREYQWWVTYTYPTPTPSP